MSITSHL